MLNNATCFNNIYIVCCRTDLRYGIDSLAEVLRSLGMRHLEEKNSPMYDKEMYKAEIEDTLQIFNVRISDYI